MLNNIIEGANLLIKQLSNMYWITDDEKDIVLGSMQEVSDSLEHVFSKLKNKYYQTGDFQMLHGVQWSFFQYFTARTIYLKHSNSSLCDRIYGLLRMQSSMDLFYQVEMPSIFSFDHPVGSVIGRGKYSDYFVFMQNCTVGNNNGIYPEFGHHVAMLSGSKVLGNCKIGNNVIISANTYIKDTDIPDNSIVFGSSPNLVIKTDKVEIINEYFSKIFRD